MGCFDDILIVTGDDRDRWNQDELDQIFYLAGRESVRDSIKCDGLSYYDAEVDRSDFDSGDEYEKARADAVEKVIDDKWSSAASDIIAIRAVPLDSRLYENLREWYENDDEKMMAATAPSFRDSKYLFYVVGCNYDTTDQNLLGGNGDGETKRRFEERFGK